MSRPVILMDGGRGGVAACMNWTQGPSLVPRPPPREAVYQTTSHVRDICENTARALTAGSMRDTGRQVDHERHRQTGALPPGDQEEVVVTGRYTRRSPIPPARIEDPQRTLYEGRRPPTPLRGPQRTERREAWQEHQPHPTRTYQPTSQTPFKATKAYLEKYMNRSLSEREINEIVTDLRTDLDRAADEEHMRQRLLSMKRPPEKYLDKPYKSMLRYDMNGARTWDRYDDGSQACPRGGYEARDLYRPHAPEAPNPQQYGSYDPRRPATAHPRSHKQVSWDVTPRTISSYPTGAYIDKSHGKHLSTWRNDKWAEDGTNYDDLLRLASKYETKRYDGHRARDDSHTRYNTGYISKTRDGKHSAKGAEKQGTVKVKLDCPEDSDLNVNVRVQSRNSSRYT